MSGSWPTLVIGIGNPYGCDDGVGIAIARYLKQNGPKDLTVREIYSDCTRLLAEWQDVTTVILIDAIRSGARPGTIMRFCPHVQPIPLRFLDHSTHAMGVGETIALARATGQLPAVLVVYGIEGKNFQPGIGLTKEVEAAVCVAGDRIIDDMRSGVLMVSARLACKIPSE